MVVNLVGLKPPCILLIVILIVVIISPTRPAVASSENKTSSECNLTFGWSDWEPLQYEDSSGRLQGIQIELAKSMASAIGCEIKFVKNTWSGVVQSIESGEIDFTANATPSTGRKAFAYFSLPYRRDTYSIWVKHKDLERYNHSSIERIKKSGIKVGLVKSQIYNDEFESWKKDPVYSKNITYFNTLNELIKNLVHGKIEALVEDPFVIAYRLRVDKIEDQISRIPVQSFGQKVSFMFSKKTINKTFVKRFNLKMRELKDTKVFQSVWLEPQLIN